MSGAALGGRGERLRRLAAPAAFAFASALALPGPSAAADAFGWKASGAVVVSHQSASDARVRGASNAAASLVLSRAAGAGAWLVHLEASTTPLASGVFGLLPEANAGAGSALDEDRRGRIQLSELSYRHAIDAGATITAGLLDVSAYFDQSRIASDETTQFLGVSFIGNPTIEFPDYTLGLVYERALAAGPKLSAALSGSHGLADNPKRSYAQLMDVRASEKGAFAIASASWTRPAWLLRVGAWAHTASHESLAGTSGGHRNHGAYLLAGYRVPRHAFNLRVGLANPEVTRAAGFAGLTYRYFRGAFVVGAGAARIRLSPHEPAPGLDDTRQYEIYLRYTLSPGAYLTLDLQRIVNSNYDASGTSRDRQVTVSGLRLTYLLR